LSRLTRRGAALLSIVACALIVGSQPAAAQSSSLPSGWDDGDIGSPVVAGCVTSSGTTITVAGAGTDIGGTADEFHFAYMPASGDLDIRVKVASLENVDPSAKAGIMIRESLQDDARHAFLFVSPGNGIGFERRVKQGRMAAQTDAGSMTTPVWVRLVRRGKTISAYTSDTGAKWTLVASSMVNMNASVYVGLAVTSHVPNKTATATFEDPNLGSATSALPAPWSASDIGNPNQAGRSTASGNVFTVTGGGLDIGGTADQFQFLYQPVTGDVQLVAWLGNLQASDAAAKAGVMIREALTEAAAHASVFAKGSSGWVFDRRQAAGSSTVETNGSSSSVSGWLKIVRAGNTFSAFESQDGAQWTLIAADTMVMPATVYVGMAVTSHSATATAIGTFANVTVSTPTITNKPPTVSISIPATASATTAGYTAPANLVLNATASDTDGSVVKVDFYANGQPVGSDASSPFSATWSNVAAGTYSLTAVATDNGGATATSPALAVTVGGAANKPPTVSITAPAPSASYTAPASVSITATALDSDGTVAKVDFYSNGQPLGSDTTSPYSFNWTNVAAGTYSVSAIATDNAGATATSQQVTVTVAAPANKPPTVSITAPSSSASYTAPANVSITATALDSDGTVAKVDFYSNGQPLGSDTTSPYIFSWTNVAAGTYTLTAIATDNTGAKTTSAGVTVTVAPPPNKPPTVSISTPAAGTVYTAPASMSIAAIASDPDGSVVRVDFYAGTQQVGSAVSSPFSVTWSGVPGGAYSLTAIATDNAGARTTSLPVSINVAIPLGATVVLTPPTDYDTNVTSLNLELRRAGDAVTTAPVTTKNLGKPAVIAGEVAVDITALVAPLPTGSYYAVVISVGPAGSTTSAPSATFIK
jgi:regulation of enolase protein 1 (concanavalin A-like superfamily)